MSGAWVRQSYLDTLNKYKNEDALRSPSMFDYENPYSEDGQESEDNTNQKMMERVSTPSVDFSKDTLKEQAPARTTAGQILGGSSDALMTFGDPSMKALGLGLKTAQGITEAKRQRQIDKYNAEVRKVQARQEALNKLSQLGQGMRA